MHDSNRGLIYAFPSALRDDALSAVATFPESKYSVKDSFSIQLAGETLSIPGRIYHVPPLISGILLNKHQQNIVDCLFTRHHDGYVRQKHLEKIIKSNEHWVPPFVLKLLGEYVVEILFAIQSNVSALDASIYRQFVKQNPEFMEKTRQRMISYWDCYYRRDYRRDEYIGFKLFSHFKALARE